MSEAKHTPGLWELEEFSDGYGVSHTVDGDLENICTFNKTTDGKELENAILCGAAPDMAEALKEFIRIDGFISMHEMFRKEWEPAISKARATLVKAGVT